VLWALALEALDEARRAELERLVAQPATSETVSRVRSLYQEADVFQKASRLVDKYQQRAEAVADEVEPEDLRRLLYYLIDTVLERAPADSPEVLALTLPPTASHA
jgi:geranylgeranyl pyrophosphate synthase